MPTSATIDRNEAKRRLDAIAGSILALPVDESAFKFGAFYSPFTYTASAHSKAVRELLPWSQFEMPTRRRIGHEARNLMRVREQMREYIAKCEESIAGRLRWRDLDEDDWVVRRSRSSKELAEQYDAVLTQAIHDLGELGKVVPTEQRRRNRRY